MATIDLRNRIIDKLLTIPKKDYLFALHKLVENSQVEVDMVHLTVEQKLMLKLSDTDIKNNKLISECQLDKSDRKWLKEMLIINEIGLSPIRRPPRS